MSAFILDGKKVRNEISKSLHDEILSFVKKGFVRPCLAIVQIGNNKESETYISNKKTFGEKLGVTVLHIHLPENIDENEVVKEVKNLNTDQGVHGIIVQFPVPKHIRKDVVIEYINHYKDVDGLGSKNVKGLWVDSGKSIIPATARGILTLLNHYGISVKGKRVAMIGRSALVGKPTALLLSNHGATVTLCHSGTVDLETVTLEADILISAVGRPRFISKYHVRPKQIVVDVGITVEDINTRRCVGDVDFGEVSEIVDYISPVPGGVGPMTVLSIFQNLMDSYKIHIADHGSSQ
jgi:methylenetetrahydrofolate dehydrogenase (NADP+) / methenyltetrahydrofolate cyclohydrolase